MTDKQIIINGIDVSKGNFRLERDNQQKCECCHATGFGVICDCEQWHNCYFKQLARAKEEIEKLKVQIENEKQALQIAIDNLNQACLDLSQENDDLLNELQAKEQECEELRKEINGYKIIIEKIRQEVQEDVTCESRECGCDSYEECIECLKNTILNIIYEERNDFVQDKMICKECGKYKQTLDEIENYVRDNSDFDKSDKLTSNTGAYDILEIINKEKDK